MTGKQDSDIARKNIEFARVRRGLSRDELAKEAGVPARSFANFLGGSQNLIEEKIGRVALVLGVTYDDLFDVAFEHKFRAGLAMPKPDTPPAPDAEFEQLVEIMAALSPAGQEFVLDFARMLAEKERAKKAK